MGVEQLGVCTRDGYGLEKDSREAINLFRSAAVKGSFRAKLLMGLCYRAAEGVEQSNIAAMEMFRELIAGEEF